MNGSSNAAFRGRALLAHHELGQDANGITRLEIRNKAVIDHQFILHFGATWLD